MNKMIIGIDVSKHDLDVAFRHNEQSFFLGKYSNNQIGFQSIYQDIEKKRQKADADTVLVVMEPTGDYEQSRDRACPVPTLPFIKVGKSALLILLMSEAGIKV